MIRDWINMVELRRTEAFMDYDYGRVDFYNRIIEQLKDVEEIYSLAKL